VPALRKQKRDSPEGRRAFLKSAIKGLAALFGLLVSVAAALSLIPPGGSGRRERRLLLGDEDEAPRRGAREMTFSYDRGGRTVTGKNIEGPPPRPLVRFPLEREEGKIYVRVPV